MVATSERTTLSFHQCHGRRGQHDRVALAANPKVAVPVCQRQYRWEIDGCEQLLADIRAVAKRGTQQTHFFGSILYAATSRGEVTERVLVDGQQRVATLMRRTRCAGGSRRSPRRRRCDGHRAAVTCRRRPLRLPRDGRGPPRTASMSPLASSSRLCPGWPSPATMPSTASSGWSLRVSRTWPPMTSRFRSRSPSASSPAPSTSASARIFTGIWPSMRPRNTCASTSTSSGSSQAPERQRGRGRHAESAPCGAPGWDHARLAEGISRLIGDHDGRVRSVNHGDRHANRTISPRRQRLLGPDEVRALPRGTALSLATASRQGIQPRRRHRRQSPGRRRTGGRRRSPPRPGGRRSARRRRLPTTDAAGATTPRADDPPAPAFGTLDDRVEQFFSVVFTPPGPWWSIRQAVVSRRSRRARWLVRCWSRGWSFQ